MAISSSDLEVADEDLGRRILARARVIAPCLDTLEDDARLDAIAILKGVVAEMPAAGQGRTKSLARNGTAITFADIQSAFDADSRASLRALCAAASSATAAPQPIGAFPIAHVSKGIWPDGAYT